VDGGQWTLDWTLWTVNTGQRVPDLCQLNYFHGSIRFLSSLGLFYGQLARICQSSEDPPPAAFFYDLCQRPSYLPTNYTGEKYGNIKNKIFFEAPFTLFASSFFKILCF